MNPRQASEPNVSVAPLRLAVSRALPPVDGRPVWSVTCLFVKAGHRRNGLSLAMLEHAKRFAAERGGRLLEGYPRDPSGGFPGASALAC